MIHRILMLLIAGLSTSLAFIHWLNGNPFVGLFIIAVFCLVACGVAYLEDFEQ